MKKYIVLLGLIALVSACKKVENGSTAAAGPKAAEAGGPPALPPYQMRAEMPGGNRLAAHGSGESLFSNRCGFCHLPGGMGTNLITVQQIKAGNKPEMGLLSNRQDLTADYVKQVVRQGKVAMPPLSRVEVTDAELDAIAAFLGRGR